MQRNIWILFVFVAGVAAIIVALGEPAKALLAYRPDFIVRAEYWRAVSGHFTHMGWPHLALNMSGLASIFWLYHKVLGAVGWTVLLLGLSLLTTAAYLILSPNVPTYLGLSAVLHGMLAAALLLAVYDELRAGTREGLIEHVVIGAGLIAKLVWEATVGPVPLTEALASGPVAAEAHLYGAVGGVAFAAMHVAMQRLFRRRP
ncbi:MAG: rhombosortase [Pseudomonadota bacterium]